MKVWTSSASLASSGGTFQVQREWAFDSPHYRALDQARLAMFRDVLGVWKAQLNLRTAWDVGCGIGNFSALLRELGFETRAIDGRAENVEEARRRVPGLDVHMADAESPLLSGMDSADLVLCVGLLYHLENPFRTIRNLGQLTREILIVESMCTEDELPLLFLADENTTEELGLSGSAFFASESCLVKMLYRAGFSHVYRLTRSPDHEDFRSSREKKRSRTILAATRAELHSPLVMRVEEPGPARDLWETKWGKFMYQARRIPHFIMKPWPEKKATLRRLLRFEKKIGSVTGEERG
jgi:SAM-dependent methyltransferase